MSKPTTTDTVEYERAYSALNKAQRAAVDTIDGPVMVIAGPGTGKTQVLALRIANILLQTDTRPEDILTLTFTDAGAAAMRERIRRYIGAAAYRVNIHTFHSFAGVLIKEYPEAFPSIIGGTPASDLERVQFIEDAIAHPDIKRLRPTGNPSYYVKPILSEINTLKQENVDPDELGTFIEAQEKRLQETEQFHTKGAHKGKERSEYTNLQKEVAKNHELQLIYRLYQATLRDAKRYDFADMITETVRALSTDETMLRDIQERFLYVLADEHQDVNGAQNEILKLIVSYHDRPNIFVVGDEKQAIYRFQGASLENFLYFQDHFKNTTVISLTENYRSGQTILDAAHDLIEVAEGPLADLRIPLHATHEGTAPQHFHFDHQGIEESWLASSITSAIKEGVPAGEIAVILRTNREVEDMTTFLRKHDLVVRPSADSDILAHPITRSLIDLITVVVEPHNEQALARLLIGPCVVTDSNSLTKLFANRSGRLSLSSLIGDEEKLKECVADAAPFLKFQTVINNARQRLRAELPHDTVAYLLRESGFLAYLEGTDPLEGGRVVRRLYDEIEELVRKKEVAHLESLLSAFRLRELYGLGLTAPFLDLEHDAVQVMTAHKSKGLEFRYVYIPHLSDNIWGTKRKQNHFKLPLTRMVKSSDFDETDDEKRLFYVGMTRAKERLIFSEAEKSAEGRELTPSRFLTKIEPTLITSSAPVGALFDPLDRVQPRRSETLNLLVIRELFAKRGFSATSINNYLDNPWHYFFRNLLRLPEMQTLPLRYGTVIHNVLEWTCKTRRNGTWPSDTDCLKRLDAELDQLPLSAKDSVSLREKGTTALMAYLPHLQSSIGHTSREEFTVTVQFETGVPELPLLPLTGKLDRLDFSKDGSLYQVVDYKTGKPRSRNQIEGKTKAADRGYKRQLEFYALLLSLYDDRRYQCNTFTLSFVEPTPKGIIKEESFIIEERDLAELKSEISSAVKAVVSGSFLRDHEAARQSEYADLAQRFLI